MEMHSYAKTRTNKKWTIEHKRKLVDNRITLDVLFNKKAFNLADSWKKLTKVSDMESFDVLFVRKQWTNILTKYKNLVQRHAINNYIDSETLDLLTAEWEFFDKIHRWIKIKEKIQKDYKSIILEEIENETLNQSIIGGDINTAGNIRHNNVQQQQQLHHKGSSEDEEPMVVLNVALPSSSAVQNNELIPSNRKTSCSTDEQFTKSITSKSPPLISGIQQQQQSTKQITKLNALEPGPSILTSSKTKEKSHKRKSSTVQVLTRRHLLNKTKRKHRKLQEKLKRLKRNYSSQKLSTKKLAKKLDGFCEIFAKVVKEEYPNINVSSLLASDVGETSSDDSTDSD